jgi:hypothetical protein
MKNKNFVKKPPLRVVLLRVSSHAWTKGSPLLYAPDNKAHYGQRAQEHPRRQKYVLLYRSKQHCMVYQKQQPSVF